MRISGSANAAGRRRVGPGDLTEIVTVEAETRTPDGYGGATSSWAQATSAYAKVEPLYVGEGEGQGGVRAVTSYRFTLYRDEAITPAMRLVWIGRPFNIRGIRLAGQWDGMMEIIADSGEGT